MMHQAIPFGGGRRWTAGWTAAEPKRSGGGWEYMKSAVEENPVVVVGRRGCCMAHVAQLLLQGQGVNPVVCEVGEEAGELRAALLEAGGVEEMLNAAEKVLPTVFVGGRVIGGLERLMAVHLAGELVPMLKQAGALWL